MAVEILVHEGRAVACFVCDWCGEPIERSEEGEARWHAVPGRRFSRPRFTHRGRCARASRDAVDDAGQPAALGLDGFLSALGDSCPAGAGARLRAVG